LKIFEPRFGFLEELLGVLLQDRSRQRAKHVLQNFLRLCVRGVLTLGNGVAPFGIRQLPPNPLQLLVSRRLALG